MTRYVDIAVAQIQQWLVRSSNLRGRRGASAMIGDATAEAAIARLLDGKPATVNAEAGRIDGVVSLRMDTDDERSASEVQDAVLRHLRAELPAAFLTASWLDGGTYADARNREVVCQTEWPAATAEWPLGRPCGWCTVWPAVDRARVDTDGKPCWLCADCGLRDAKAEHATSSRRPPPAERRLLARLGPSAGAVPDEFRQLAEMTLGGERDDTHLATVFADGNAVGAFIRTLHASGVDVRTVPKTLDDATWHALCVAAQDVAGRRQAASAAGEEDLPLIPHLVGGDDVLVSIPAHGAWAFVQSLSGAFTDYLAAHSPLDGVTGPTLSAGVVVHHFSEPNSSVVELATALLKRAKREHLGRDAALAWQDITHDGPVDLRRPSVTVAALDAHGPALTALAALAGSQRQRLAALCRAVETAATDDDRAARRAALDQHVARMGLSTTLAPFSGSDIMALADALGIVRWWPV